MAKADRIKRGDRVYVGQMLRDRVEYEVAAVGNAKRDVLVRLPGTTGGTWVCIDDVHLKES